MKWEESLKQLPADGGGKNYEKLYRISLLAYLEGCSEEKGKPSKHIAFVAAGCLGTDACRLSETGQRGKSYVMRTALT